MLRILEKVDKTLGESIRLSYLLSLSRFLEHASPNKKIPFMSVIARNLSICLDIDNADVKLAVKRLIMEGDQLIGNIKI